MAMVMLNIGILAIVAAFNSSALALERSDKISTGAAIADGQMELYRGLLNSNIELQSSTIPATAPYTTDAAYSASQVTTASCPANVPANACNASRTLTGPDHHKFRIDVYIVYVTQAPQRQVTQVTVVVRDGLDTSKVWAREQSTFDQSTGCNSTGC